MKNKKITHVILGLLRKWEHKGFSPLAINVGNCDDFAQDILDKVSSDKAIWGEDYPELFKTDVDCEGHCFFAFRGRYYDSECPQGVSSPDQLPYYLRQTNFSKTLDLSCEYDKVCA